MLTVRVVVAVTLLPEEPEVETAVMVVFPIATAVASPALLMVAMLVAEEVQVTWEVKSCVPPLPRVAVAVNCCVFPGGTEVLLGVTASDTTELLETKKLPQPGANNMIRMATAGLSKLFRISC